MRAPCDAATVLKALEAATARLAERVEHVNQLNVYPVPDGDTGTNMLHTMRAALAAAREAEQSMGAILAAAAHGALMGARGNSGVILSQIIAGAKAALADAKAVDAARAVTAFAKGREMAYQAVANPVEGTILTAIREVAEAVRGQEGRPLGALLDRALAAAREATARTPDLLPVHKRAGVVDAGAQGLVYVLEGAADLVNGRAARTYRGETPAEQPRRAVRATGDEWGYDVQFLVPEPKRAPRELRDEMLRFGLDDPSLSCVLVVGDESVVKVHVHTKAPHEILRIGLSAGTLRDILVESLDEAAAERERATGVALTRAEVEALPLAALAVVSGAGLAEICRSLGAEPLAGGPTANPSVEDILRAIERSRGERVLVLPNDANVQLAAERAAREALKPVTVVPTRTMAQGLAALALGFDAHGDLGAVAAKMEEAARSVRTLEVTRATEDRDVGGVKVRAGEHLALVDGSLVGTGPSAEEALGIAAGEVGSAELCTLYLGAEADEAGARKARSLLEETLGCEVEVKHGGQPHYPYIVSAE